MNLLPIQLLCIVMILLSSCSNTNTPEGKELLKMGDSIKIKDSIKPATTNKIDQISYIGFDLVKNESVGEIKIGLESKALLKSIGAPDDKTKAALWEADGAYHQTWNYTKQGLKLDMVGPADSVQTVNMITITGPCALKTKRNIGVGNSTQEVIIAYKEVIDTASVHTETIIAGTVYGGIQFGIENKKVKSIFIGASAE